MKLLVLDGNSLVNRAYFGIKLLTTKDGRYTNIGPIAPYYDRTEPVYYLVRAKV